MIIRCGRLALIGAVVVLVSCNGDADPPSTLPDVTTSPSPAATETATPGPAADVDPPVEPDGARDYSAEGVEAFTRYAIDVINYASATNEVETLRMITTRDCQTCNRAIDDLEQLAGEGGHIEGGMMLIEHVYAQEPTDGVQPGSVVDATVTESTRYDSSGNITNSEVEELIQFVFFLLRESDQWKLDGIEFGQGQPQRSSS